MASPAHASARASAIPVTPPPPYHSERNKKRGFGGGEFSYIFLIGTMLISAFISL